MDPEQLLGFLAVWLVCVPSLLVLVVIGALAARDLWRGTYR